MVEFPLDPALSKMLIVSTEMGCSAEIEESNPPKPNPLANFKHQVKGAPSINGTWLSGCEYDFWSKDYVVFAMKIKGQNLKRQVTYFSDYCHTEKDNYVGKGYFRYLEDYNSFYELEYKIKSNGGYFITGENLSIDSEDQISISNRLVGSSSYPGIKLYKVTEKK